MHILFVTEQFPFPLHDGGNLRTYHLLRSLADEHQVTLVSHGPRESGIEANEVLPFVQRIECVAKPGTMRRLAHSGRKLGVARTPLFILKNWSAPLLAAIENVLAHETVDALHFNHLDTACYALEREWGIPRVFDTHNCLSAMARQVARDAKSPWRRWVYQRESRLLENCERTVCQQMDATLVCSELDAEAFRALGATRPTHVVPNGVDIDYFSSDPTAETEPGTLVFTGAMNYYPNEQAVLWFCREILPRLANSQPVVRLLIVGKNPTPAVRALHDGQRVVVTGAVPDVRDYVRRAAVFVVPLKHGSGTRLKILEAFAMGKAVVSTRLGAEGIAAVDGEHLRLADQPSEFADQIAHLLGNQVLRQQLGSRAQQLVRQSYGWPQIGAGLRDIYRGLGHRRSVLPAAVRLIG